MNANKRPPADFNLLGDEVCSLRQELRKHKNIESMIFEKNLLDRRGKR